MSDGAIVLDVRTASPHFPGIGRATIGLARSLAGVEGRPPLALLHAAAPDARLPLDRLPGIVCGASPFDLAQQLEVRRLLHASRARLYHSPYYLMPFLPGVCAVVTCYDLIPLTVAGLFDRARRVAFRIGHTLAFRAASAIVVPSQATARDVAACFPSHAHKVQVIRLGREFGTAAAGETDEPAPPSLGSGSYVLAVGSNKPHKNLRVLVEAWSRVVERRRVGADLRLALAGPRDPRYDEGGATAERLRQAGRLVSLGRVNDESLAGLYRRAALFVLPSKAEGFGFPALEAMSCGVPVACSRIDALRELCGDAAVYFDPENAGALADLLERLLNAADERERLRKAGLERAAEFSWDRTAQETTALYRRVIGGRG